MLATVSVLGGGEGGEVYEEGVEVGGQLEAGWRAEGKSSVSRCSTSCSSREIRD